jgi:hypothetical protein
MYRVSMFNLRKSNHSLSNVLKVWRGTSYSMAPKSLSVTPAASRAAATSQKLYHARVTEATLP